MEDQGSANCKDHERRIREVEITLAGREKHDLRIDMLEKTQDKILSKLDDLGLTQTRSNAIVAFLVFVSPFVVPWIKDAARQWISGG